MENNNGAIRSVAWKELCPWLCIFRVFRMSIALPAIVLAAMAVLLMSIGWWIAASLFSTDSPATMWLRPYASCPWTAATGAVPDRPTWPDVLDGEAVTFEKADIYAPSEADFAQATKEREKEMGELVQSPRRPAEPFFSSWGLLNRPVREGLLSIDLSPSALVCLVLCGLWAVGVWAFFGAAITRIAAVQLATGERIGIASALRHAAAKWPAYFFAPLLPLGGVLLAVIPVFIVGLLLHAGLLLLLAGVVLWPLVLAAAFAMVVLLLGTLFGWPLMWATISTEGTDSFDALSRSYAYTFQRPLKYLFYAIVAGVLGGLGWLLVKNFAAAVVWMGYWAASWGAGAEQIKSIMGDGEPLTGFSAGGAWMIHFWTGCVKLLAVGYLFSYFWTASSCIYLLLRRDVDATEMDEVFLDADASEQAAALPPIGADSAGAPVAEGDLPKDGGQPGESGPTITETAQ